MKTMLEIRFSSVRGGEMMFQNDGGYGLQFLDVIGDEAPKNAVKVKGFARGVPHDNESVVYFIQQRFPFVWQNQSQIVDQSR